MRRNVVGIALLGALAVGGASWAESGVVLSGSFCGAPMCACSQQMCTCGQYCSPNGLCQSAQAYFCSNDFQCGSSPGCGPFICQNNVCVPGMRDAGPLEVDDGGLWCRPGSDAGSCIPWPDGGTDASVPPIQPQPDASVFVPDANVPDSGPPPEGGRDGGQVAGLDAGLVDAGPTTPGDAGAPPVDAGPITPREPMGCGCDVTGGVWLALAALFALRLGRRRTY
jgi:MYXO-CTERM domain-containing protein